MIITKVVLWLKHYWWALLFPIGIIVGIWFMMRDGSEAAKKVLAITKDSHKKQKQALEQIEKEKREAEAAAKKIHEKAISEIEAKHSADLVENKKVTKKEIKKLGKKFKNDPQGLAKAFADEFGLNLEGLRDEDGKK